MTKLPDGSGCFTATILSNEEIAALPLKARPLSHRISSEIYHAVFEAIGQASMCWKPRPGGEVFSSEEAADIAVKLCFKIADEVEKWKTASATEVCAENPAIAEYVADLESRLSELDYLRWFKQNADFGPADGDVQIQMDMLYIMQTGKPVPEGWVSNG